MNFLSRFSHQTYIIMRASFGGMFAFHGFQKVFNVLNQHPVELGSQMWFGGMIELIAGLMIAAGVKTRYAAFLSSGTMAVAYIQYHWRFQGGVQLLPAINHGEHALLYAFVFLYIACKGKGSGA